MTNDQLVELIYAGLDDPAHWQSFLDGFRARLNARLATLSLVYAEACLFTLVLNSGLAEADRAALDQWGTQNPWLARIDWTTANAGEVCASHHLCPDAELEASEVYRRLYGPKGWHYGAGIVLGSAPYPKALLSSVRPRELGPLDENELALHHALSPHLVRALALHEERLRVRHQQAASEALLEASHNALFLLSETGEIRLVNAAGRQLLKQRQLLATDRGFLRVADPDANARLLQAIGCVGSAGAQLLEKSLVLTGVGESTLWATVSKLAACGDLVLASHAPAVALTLTDPTLRPRLSAEPLQQLYGLTPAEAHVALLLADGLAPEDAAVRLGVALETVRTHIKRSLSKTGVNRQSELVALVFRAARPALARSSGGHS